MTTDTDKLVESFADAFYEQLKHGDAAHQQWLRKETDKFFAAHAPAFRDRIIASLCGDVEPVAWRFRWNPQGDWHITSHEPRGGDGTNKEPLYSASTVAALKAERDALRENLWAQDVRCGKLEIEKGALKAKVAELEKDAARLEFVCNSPNRMVERESGLWRVYEDVAPTDHPTAVWQGMTPRWHVTPREAIDAAITAALTKGQP